MKTINILPPQKLQPSYVSIQLKLFNCILCAFHHRGNLEKLHQDMNRIIFFLTVFTLAERTTALLC